MKEKKKLRKSKGFTLVELVIVIAIVIVLSVVSIPIYRNYVDKAKMTEGYALLGTILSAQKAYYSEYGYFLRHIGWTTYDIRLGVDARGNKYFTEFRIVTQTNDHPYYYSGAEVYKPIELRDNGHGILYLQYNITKGVKFTEVYDSSWY